MTDLTGRAARAPGRPRSAEADRAILEAALDAFVENGYEGMSVEARLWRALQDVEDPEIPISVVGMGLIVALAYGLTRVFSGRAAFLHLGAMLGTIMAANVWRRIIPAQEHMLAATRAGKPVDVTYGERAKMRSIHNHYLTLPVLFTMLSNHFPGTWGHPLAWASLVSLVVLGASVKYVMNFGVRSNRWIVLAGAVSFVGAVIGAALIRSQDHFARR